MKPLVIKVSGGELDSSAFVRGLAVALKGLGRPLLLVHGGGKGIGLLQQRLGIEPRFVEGLRVTDEATLEIVEMALRGTANVRLVAALVEAGLPAIGVSGVDGGLVRAEPVPELGRVGHVASVQAERLLALLGAGFLPVICPVCLGPEGLTYNVNADEVARALALAVEADGLAFVSVVPGVLQGEALLASLDGPAAERLLADGTINGGMMPKVRAALEAARQGLRVAILDLEGLPAWARGEAVGTTLVAEGERWS